jgi:predicted PurR-regulated permease PerM
MVSNIRKEVQVFTSLEDFLSEFNKIEYVRLDNYKNLFLGGFAFLSLILALFLFAELRNYLRRNISRLCRRTRRRVKRGFRKISKNLLSLRNQVNLL